MRRREFIAGVGCAATWPIAARAQQPNKIARIGFLGATYASRWASRVAALRTGLSDLGYVEGKNLAIEFRWAEGRYERLGELADELVRLKVDLILTAGTPGTLAAKRATQTIPIVMATTGDAVDTGLVVSLDRPGGNITGSTHFGPELWGKQLELLKEAIPRVNKVGVLVNPNNPLSVLARPDVTGKVFGVALEPFEARHPNEFVTAFSVMGKKSVDAVLVFDDGVFVANAEAIAELATTNRIPSSGFKELAQAGGLIGYGVNFLELWRRSAYFVDKIFRGAKPADLPVERATRFELVINLKTANTLGLTIPPTLFARADEVIE